jgi:hypothetical protein
MFSQAERPLSSGCCRLLRLAELTLTATKRSLALPTASVRHNVSLSTLNRHCLSGPGALMLPGGLIQSPISANYHPDLSGRRCLMI